MGYEWDIPSGNLLQFAIELNMAILFADLLIKYWDVP